MIPITTPKPTTMKANELRIGNWYNEFGIPKKANATLIVALSQIEIAGKIAIDISPIPLTPEILEKAGFENEMAEYNDFNIVSNFYNAECGINITLHDDGEYCFEFGDQGNMTVIQYLHQLQNLYFALTGQELTIDLNH